jgi:hypothetical protein
MLTDTAASSAKAAGAESAGRLSSLPLMSNLPMTGSPSGSRTTCCLLSAPACRKRRLASAMQPLLNTPPKASFHASGGRSAPRAVHTSSGMESGAVNVSSAASIQPAASKQAPASCSRLCTDRASGNGTHNSRNRWPSKPGGFRGAFPPGADLDPRAICTGNHDAEYMQELVSMICVHSQSGKACDLPAWARCRNARRFRSIVS